MSDEMQNNVEKLESNEEAVVYLENTGKDNNGKKKVSRKAVVAIVLAFCVIIFFFATADSRAYSKAMKLKDSGNYQEAQMIFEELDDYKDSVKQKNECLKYIVYEQGKQSMDNGEYEAALIAFESLNNFEDSRDLRLECLYQLGKQLLSNNDYKNASTYFEQCKKYKDSIELNKKCKYEVGAQYLEEKNYEEAIEWLKILDYKDSKELYKKCKYEVGIQYLEEKDYDKAIEWLEDLDYKDSKKVVDNILNGERSLNSFIERYNAMTEIIEQKIGVSIDKIDLSNVNEEEHSITTSLGAEVQLNKFTDDENLFKYEINSFLWVKTPWILVDGDLLTADMCCVASGLLPDASFEEIISNIANASENASGIAGTSVYGSAELDGYKYVIAYTKKEADFSMTPLD